MRRKCLNIKTKKQDQFNTNENEIFFFFFKVPKFVMQRNFLSSGRLSSNNNRSKIRFQ